MSKDAIATRETHSQESAFQKPVTGTNVSTTKRALDVWVQGTTGGSPLADVDWDALDVQQTSAVIDTYVFKVGGLGGLTVATCTVTYTSSTKTDLDTVVWS